ncbi:MAG: GPI inositol-deacylase, partial [Bacteroidales bacterium]|nr:GPI inositol-deacylase [Bacteroidales bacterium]
MKKFSIFLLILISVFTLQAQSEEFTHMFDSVFQHVSRAEATTGILYNRVLPFSGLYRFSTVRARQDTANAEVFKQACRELYEAAFIPAARLPFDADKLADAAGNLSSTVDIGILHCKYNVLNDTVIRQKLYWDADSVIRENRSVAASLYREETAFIVSPLAERMQGSSVTFCFKELLRFDNTGNPIAQLYANFGAGSGWQPVRLNSSVTVYYDSSRLYVMQFMAIFGNGDTAVTRSQVSIENSSGGSKGVEQPSNWPWMDKYDKVSDNDMSTWGHYPQIEAKIDYADYAGNTGKYKGNVWVYYAHSDKKLRKPVLIVDGFDPGNKRQFEKHLNGDKDATAKSLWKLMDYFDEEEHDTVNFARKLLEDYGYDLVVLDFPEGGGYIEKNAMVCIEVINRINDRLMWNGSKEEIVIVGPSMGGQITRYALTYMEQHPGDANCRHGDHNCRLWVSLDSPHQGANISMGAQELIKYFSFAAKEQWDKTLCCPAALQMLTHHASPLGLPYYTHWNTVRRTNNPATNGYPEKLRKIAVANGSFHNVPNRTAYQIVFNAQLLWTFALTPLLGATPITADITLRSALNSGTGEVMKVLYNFLILSTSTTRGFNNNTGKCSPDAAPGGNYNTFDQIESAVKSLGPVVNTNLHTHCFMPITSTLDIQGNVDHCTDISGVDLVARKLTPFQSYCGPGDAKNMYHVTFDQHIVDYLVNELETYINMDGSQSMQLCQMKTVTLHLPANKVNNTIVTWTCSLGLEIVSGQGTPTVQVRAKTAGSAWIKATSSNLSYNKEVKQFDITVSGNSALPPLPSSFDITGNQHITWNTPVTLDRELNIRWNGELRITAPVYCTPGADIRIQGGGHLIIDGGTLTNACDGQMWTGVKVYSIPVSDSTDYGAQGVVTLQNGATVSNAQTAIRVIAPEENSTVLTGSIRARNTRFVNNRTAIEFSGTARTTKTHYSYSGFSLCSFEITPDCLAGWPDLKTQATLHS